VLFVPMIAATGGLRAMRTHRFHGHLARNAVHYAAQFLWFLAITMIPIAEVVAIEFTVPVWVALLAAIVLGERMTAARIAAVVLGIAGVAIIVRPTLDHVDVGQVVALLAAIGFAGSIILVKSLTRTESVVSIIFWMLVIQSVIGAILAAIWWQTPPATIWPWLVVIAICGTYSHFCMAHALRHAEATTVVPLDFLRVPLTALAAWLVFAERFDLYTVVGAAVILGGNLLNLKRGASCIIARSRRGPAGHLPTRSLPSASRSTRPSFNHRKREVAHPSKRARFVLVLSANSQSVHDRGLAACPEPTRPTPIA